MKVETYQYYQTNICLDGISIKMLKYLKNILTENNIILKVVCESIQIFLHLIE